MEVAPGAFHLRGALDVDGQREIFARCRFLMDGPVAAYVPVVRGGGKMHVRMLCLGRHWNGKTYRYEPIRSDFDGQPAPPIPDEFRALARRLAESVGMTLDPDVCIMNYYDAEGRMGLHQDKDESERSLAAGLPVVSVSIGDTARFLFGGLKRREPIEAIQLESGDAFVFGPETRGLPADILESCPAEHRLRIPMLTTKRSLNLSNAAAVIVYEAWRQLGFKGSE